MTTRLSLAAALAFAVLATGCMTPPDKLDRSLDKSSAAGLYHVTLVPPASQPPINQMHAWQVKLATPEGTPVQGARFAVGGGMPQHGHGFPTRPRITRELPDGRYVLDGMKFSMPGWWDLKLDLQGPAGADQVVFNIVLDASGARQ